MEQDLLDRLHMYLDKYHIIPNVSIESIAAMNMWFKTTHARLTESYPNGMTDEHYAFSSIARLILEDAATMNNIDIVHQMLEYSTCSGALLESLFNKKQYEIIHKIIESGKLSGAAGHVFTQYKEEYNNWTASL